MTPAFSNPWTMQEIEKILALAKQQQPDMSQPTNAQPEPQPQASGTDIVNREMERAIRPAPNPYQIGLEQNIGAQKAIWEAANDTLNNNLATYAKTNRLTEDAARAMLGAQQQTAHDAAESFRNQLTASGLGTEGYSALGNSFADVQNQLATRQAQDIAEAFNGAYSMTTDQYYDRKYEEAIMRGLSARRANRLASSQAREYQANRVAYLDGLYNSWGRNEAGVTNPIGMQVLGMIAQDNPMLANLYAQVYPTPMNEYNNANEIAKEMMKQGHQERLLGIGQQHTLDRMKVANDYNIAQILAGGEVTRQNATHNHWLAKEMKIFEGDLQLQEAAKARQFANEEQERAYEKQLNRSLAMGQALGLSGADLKEFVAINNGYKMPSAKASQDAKRIERAQDLYSKLTKAREDLMKGLAENNFDGNTRKMYEGQLEELNLIIQQLTKNFATEYNLEELQDLQEYTGNPEIDQATVERMIAKFSKDATRDEIIATFKEWIHGSAAGANVPDILIENYVDNRFGFAKTPPTGGNASQSQTHTKQKKKDSTTYSQGVTPPPSYPANWIPK